MEKPKNNKWLDMRYVITVSIILLILAIFLAAIVGITIGSRERSEKTTTTTSTTVEEILNDENFVDYSNESWHIAKMKVKPEWVAKEVTMNENETFDSFQSDKALKFYDAEGNTVLVFYDSSFGISRTSICDSFGGEITDEDQKIKTHYYNICSKDNRNRAFITDGYGYDASGMILMVADADFIDLNEFKVVLSELEVTFKVD